MAKLSEHFSDHEFKCRDCNDLVGPPDELVTLLELVRCHFKRPVIITSGYRCPDYNKKVGGATQSKHKYGKAADIVVKGTNPKHVYRFLDKQPSSRGLGLYAGFVHVDCRETKNKARWTG